MRQPASHGRYPVTHDAKVSVVFLQGSSQSRSADDSDEPFKGFRPAGFVRPAPEPLLWEGDQN